MNKSKSHQNTLVYPKHTAETRKYRRPKEHLHVTKIQTAVTL